MADLRPDRPIEKPLYNPESLKEKVKPGTERERFKQLEQAREKIINEMAQANKPAPAAIGPVIGAMAPESADWRRQKQIENILARGLEDIYLNLTPERKKIFKQVGEETAVRINKILAKAKVNLGAIVKLIRKWLKLIPGVNKYFLEQEAKIRADEIIKLKKSGDGQY